MSDLLVNLAALRAQFNEGSNDLVKQFMPLVGYAISQIKGNIVSETELQEKIFETMQFEVPYGAIRVFINRAVNRRYNYLIKNGDGTYSPNREELSQIRFNERRKEAQRHQDDLRESFRRFSFANFGSMPDDSDVDHHFFEILFDIAPQIMRSLANPSKFVLEPDPIQAAERSIRYRIYKFVGNAVSLGNQDLEHIEEFIQGAVMAESFYYSTPNEALYKMMDVRVFLDTGLLISGLGHAEDEEVRATRELIDLLRILKAKVRCFLDTRNEMHGILYAISQAKSRGQPYSRRPGDIGDIFNRKGYDLSDLQTLMDSLDARLADQGITVEERPLVAEGMEVHIDEVALTRRLTEEFTKGGGARSPVWAFSTEKRVRHDVDVLRAVFQFRGGKPRTSIERCTAVFVTGNAGVVRIAAEHFEEHFAEETIPASAVPVCMPSSVFTMLMWLKATNRKPNIAKDQLVANSLAAITPSAEVWGEFVNNLRKLLDRGDITREEFDYISNALETRTILMSQTEGDPDAITLGTTIRIKERVMDRLIGERDQTIDDLRRRLEESERKLVESDAKYGVDSEIKQSVLRSFREVIRRVTWVAVRMIVSLPFLVLFLWDAVRAYQTEGWAGFSARTVLLFAATLLTIASLFVIAPWKRRARIWSDRLANRLAGRLGLDQLSSHQSGVHGLPGPLEEDSPPA